MHIRDIFLEYTVPDFDKIKERILKEIKDNRGQTIHTDEDGSKLSDTNYFIAYEKRQFPYSRWMWNIFNDFFHQIGRDHGYAVEWKGQCWHQVYERGDTHGWHTHAYENMSSVFYIQCEENEGTVFKIGNHDYRYPPREGMILSFPSALLHRTLPHDSDRKRIIISINWNRMGLNNETEV